jgi:PAS domain S-box-containing protein
MSDLMSDLPNLSSGEHNLDYLYKYIVEIDTEGIWVINRDMEVIFANQKLADLLGYSLAEIYGNTLSRFMDIETMAIADLEFQARLHSKAETKSDYDFKFVRKDGSSLWAIVVTRPLFEQNSAYIGSLGMITNVTKRHQQERNLRESEEYYRLLAEHSTDMVSYHNADTTFTYASSMCLSLTGYRAEELANYPLIKFIHPEDRERVKLTYSMTLAHIGLVNRITYRFAQKSGDYIWLEMTKKALIEPNTGQVKVICSTRDIQQRKEMEQTLEKTNSRLNLALEASTIGTWEWNILNGYVTCSKRTIDIFGYEAKDMDNLTYKDFLRSVHTSDRNHIVTAFRNAVYNRIGYAIQFRIIRGDGKLVWVDGRGQVYCDAEGKPNFVIGVAIDITQSKETEQEVKRQLQKELLLRQITENIRFKFDLNRIFETTANQLGEAFNLDRCLVHTCNPKSEEKIQIVAQYLQSSTYVSLLNMEIPLMDNPHGQEVLSADRAIAIDDVYKDTRLSGLSDFCRQVGLKSLLVARTSYQGKANGLICLQQCARYRHWTKEEMELLEAVAAQVGIAIAQAQLLEIEKSQKLQLKSQNQSLQESQRLAEAANNAKSEFLAMMSHEIRTPMNAVIGITELLLESELSSQDKEYIQMIQQGGQSLTTIINDILDFSKIESNNLELESIPINIWDCINSVVELLKPTAIAKSLNLICAIAPSVPQIIKGDSTRIRQILTNLLSNAIKFTEVGQIEIIITANKILEQLSDRDFYELKFTVKDTGIGIPSHLMTRLFKPFSQVDASTTRQHGGTGLGLAISKKLTEMMGGTMWVTSRSIRDRQQDPKTLEYLAGEPPTDFAISCPLEFGSTFYSLIKTVAISNNELASISAQKYNFIKPPLAHQIPLKILLVEDNLVNQKVALKLLERMGYSADIAENGLKAIKRIQKSTYDVVFMDIQMPEMDGITATKEIRRSNQDSPYIIAMTANAMIGDREIYIEAGMNGYVTKPISIEKIGNALMQVQS